MAWRMVDVTRSCGHREPHKIIKNSYPEVDAEAARLATKKCKACWRADEQAVRDARLQEATGLALPPLEGTDAQIAFAASQRATILRDLAVGHVVAGRVNGGPAGAAKIAPITAAWWWIETPLPKSREHLEALVQRCRTMDVEKETKKRPTLPVDQRRR